jgi:hypothetical protein
MGLLSSLGFIGSKNFGFWLLAECSIVLYRMFDLKPWDCWTNNTPNI